MFRIATLSMASLLLSSCAYCMPEKGDASSPSPYLHGCWDEAAHGKK